VTPLTFATWIVVALLTAWGAGVVMKDGGHGLKADIPLGLAGSGGAWVLASTLDMFPEPGMIATAVVAFAGAAGVIAVQRRFFHAPLARERTPTWRR
jgi:uncharacterized membrane protein YeaQ/YmgE (transglycosylase-associated protein family)